MNDYFSLPTNIKQIGSIGDGIRIYMEDYVCTYLTQYAQAGGYDERLAMLAGRYLLIDSQPVLFINGAIQGKYTEEVDGLLHFTEKSSAYTEAMMAEFFEGMEVVGWMQTQPGYGTFLNQQYAAYHFREFPKVNQVMFVMDPMENVNAFYVYNDDRSSLAEARGYFIYYDRNTNMHEYMLSNKATEGEYTDQSAAFVEVPKIERVETAAPVPDSPFLPDDAPEDIIRKRKEKRNVKRNMKEHKRTLNLLVSMSAVLFVVCFVLGAGLIQSQNRIGTVETQIIQLGAAYRNLYTHVANPVFAPVGGGPFAADGSFGGTPSGGIGLDESGESAGTGPLEGTVSNGGPSNEGTPNEGILNEGIPNEGTPVEVAGEVNNLPNLPTLPNLPENSQNGNGMEIDGIPVGPPVNIQPGPVGTPDPNNATQAAPGVPVPGQQARFIPETYTIQPGDSLSGISIYFYGTDRVAEILELNGMDDPNMIIAGRTILLP